MVQCITNSTIIVHSTTQYIHIYSSYSSIAPHFFLLKCNKSSFLASCRLWKSLPSISHWIMESSHQWHLVIPMVTTEKPLDIRDILVGSGWWYTMVYLPWWKMRLLTSNIKKGIMTYCCVLRRDTQGGWMGCWGLLGWWHYYYGSFPKIPYLKRTSSWGLSPQSSLSPTIESSLIYPWIAGWFSIVFCMFTRGYRWLVVYLPLWNIWVRQLGWWNSQYMESHRIPWFLKPPTRKGILSWSLFKWHVAPGVCWSCRMVNDGECLANCVGLTKT